VGDGMVVSVVVGRLAGVIETTIDSVSALVHFSHGGIDGGSKDRTCMRSTVCDKYVRRKEKGTLAGNKT
jgi:hypothetical protein